VARRLRGRARRNSLKPARIFKAIAILAVARAKLPSGFGTVALA